MSILQGTLSWLNKSRVAMAAGVGLLASISALSAGCSDFKCRLKLNSNIEAVDQIKSTATGNEGYAWGSIREFIKSGISFIRNNPLQAITVFLALQNQGSALSVPSASAQFTVTHTNQIILFNVSDPTPIVRIMPMVIMGINTNARCNATITLSNQNAGVLRSIGSRGTLYSRDGTWTGEDAASVVTDALSRLSVFITSNYDQAFNLSVVVYDIIATADRVTGTIQIMPTVGVPHTSQSPTTTYLRTSIAGTTTGTTSEVPTMSSLATTTSGSRSLLGSPTTFGVPDESSRTVRTTQDAIDSTVHSPLSLMLSVQATTQTIAPIPASTTEVLSHTETSDIPSVGQASQSPDVAIIGGVVGGGVALLGCIAAVIGVKRGLLCGGTKKSAEDTVQDPEKAMKNQYGKVVLPQNTYEKVAVADLLPEAPYDSPQQAMQGFSQYGRGPAEKKSLYESTEAPFN